MTSEYRLAIYASFNHNDTKEDVLEGLVNDYELEVLSEAELDFRVNLRVEGGNWASAQEISRDVLRRFRNIHVQGYLDVFEFHTSYRLEEGEE